jgi:hypothetical protein
MVLFLGDLLKFVYIVTTNISAGQKPLSLYFTSVLYLNFKVSFKVLKEFKTAKCYRGVYFLNVTEVAGEI